MSDKMNTTNTATDGTKQIDFTRVNSDVNGNPRYVCHFLKFINKGDEIKANTKGIGSISYEYELAIKKAKTIGGRKFHNKQYGGGIVFQSYSTNETQGAINKIREVNTNFKKEWSKADFKKVEKAIYKHFLFHTYKWQPTHDKESQKHFHPFNFAEIDSLLGLAYTSTGEYAGLWVCNGGYMMANETHYFTGFMISENGQVVASVEDENENTIFIEL